MPCRFGRIKYVIICTSIILYFYSYVGHPVVSLVCDIYVNQNLFSIIDVY
jgi:hypothetical protein